MGSEMLRKHLPVSPSSRSNESKVNRTVFAKMFKIPLPPDIDCEEQLEHVTESQKKQL